VQSYLVSREQSSDGSAHRESSFVTTHAVIGRVGVITEDGVVRGQATLFRSESVYKKTMSGSLL
jgi:hypothetical protein